MNDQRPTTNQPEGLLIIDKPATWTSHDVVAKIRRILGVKKVGHAGTLDPMATGVLIILVGSATKLSDQLLTQDKTYQAEITFGQQTDTGDADGRIINTDDATWLTQSDIEKVLPLLTGTRDQTVPAYAAVKIGGRKLYDLARSGTPIEQRPVRTITIHSIKLDSFDPAPPLPKAALTIHCSKGTYIRVLAEEIADKLNTLAHLTALRRLSSGQFTINQAITLNQLQQAGHPESLLQRVSE